MAAVTSIVLADAQATPVNHTFVPIGQDKNGVWWFEDQSTSQSLGFNRISLAITKPTNPAPGAKASDRVTRVKWGIHLPTMETLGTADSGLTPSAQVAYVTRASGEFILPERSILQNRKDLRKYVDFLMAEAQFVAMSETLIPIW